MSLNYIGPLMDDYLKLACVVVLQDEFFEKRGIDLIGTSSINEFKLKLAD
jgi:hypothetical protein